MPRSNDEVARQLAELATLTELAEGSPNAFRVRAYQNAERAVRGLADDVAELDVDALAAVKGIGKSIAGRIREYVEHGRISRLEELRAAHPVGQVDLLAVPGLGPKTVTLLAEELGVRDLAGLARVLEDGSLAALPGLGERTADKLRQAIDTLGLDSKHRRVPIATALPAAERLLEVLRAVPGVVRAEYAGSLRRFTEDVGDLDVLVAATDPGAAHAALRDLTEVELVLGSGETKTSVRTRDGLQIDLRVVPEDRFGAALVYFTGSKAHNIRLRQRAQERHLTLNEYALADPSDERVVAAVAEDEVYEALGLPWIPPELREDDGEIEAAEQGTLPTLVETRHLRGDLHDHTDLSGDGEDALEDLVAAAAARSLAYLAITDHAENLSMNGVDREALRRQRARVRDLEEERADIHLLHGAELNIAIDGSLDYDDDFLATFDWLVASVHSHFGRGVDEQTARVVRAIRHPSVSAIGHLTGRMIGRRPGIELDTAAVLDAAAEAGTAIEINASLSRLDASAALVREGARRGVTFVVSSDAHRVTDLERLRFGAAQARRGWLDAERVANTWPWTRFASWLADLHDRR